MQIDATTMADLEVFGSGSGGGLFECIDYTATARGKAALRRRLQQPAADEPSIRSTQDAVRFFHGHPGLRLFDGVSTDAVSKYVQSNIAVESRSALGAWLEHAFLSIRYPRLLLELRAGVSATVAFFTHVTRVCTEIERLGPPPEVGIHLHRLKETAGSVLICSRRGTLLLQDQAFRGSMQSAILQALDDAGELDALHGMASATRTLGYTFPEIIKGESFVLEAEGVFHPFIKSPVRNPVRLNGGEPMVFLTGPNMAGKTTYLRSVALVVLLAQTGMGVPAERARLCPVEALFTSLNPADNLRAGLSYFFAEVLRVKQAATLLADGQRALVIFDEVFKGTNVRDALEASAEVIHGFAKARKSGFIFSSHLTELVQVLKSNHAIKFYCFDGEIRNGRADYSYELREGVSDKRLGLVLLHQAEVPQLIARIGA